MGSSRTPRKAPEPLSRALEQALEPWLLSAQSSAHQTQSPKSSKAAFASRVSAPLAIALSGGLDSSVLLHVAATLLKPLRVPLLAIHINHGLSPQADKWGEFCASRSAQLGVPIKIVKVTLAKRASVEAAAREARYEALRDTAHQAGAGVLVIAHHANDQAETVLLNLLRGTGIPGLRGIAAEQSMGATRLIRPWLTQPRSVIEDYAKRHGLEWVDDESNDDLHFRRNALRAKVVPVLTQFAPDLLERIGALARHAKDDAHLLDVLARIDLSSSSHAGLNVEELLALDRARGANLLRFWLANSGFGVPGEATLLQWLVQLGAANTRATFQFAGQRFAVTNGHLVNVQPAKAAVFTPEAIDVHWSGEARLEVPSWNGALHFEMAPGAGIDPQMLLGTALSVRPRQGGERLQLVSHAPSRSLKNLYQEAGIGTKDRLALPLMYCGDNLLYAAGIGMNLRQCNRAADSIHLRWVSRT